jgi:alpha-amylase/alpha-mannosidase (GH57 family)
MEQHHPTVVKEVIAAHHRSVERTGHSNAMAQVYHHSILPLADRVDKETEVRWGIADYQYRFGCRPEGMWLAETAVDTETLEVMVDAGIKYVVLAARQAKTVLEEGHWKSVTEHTLNTSQSYWCELPLGKRIAVYFYDPDLAMDVAFRGALNNGVDFANKIVQRTHSMKEDALLNFATDGESYGHHHRHGEVALGYCFERLVKDPSITLTNYGAYLEHHPPEHSVRIVENSSWSCAHGVDRWRSNCGCVIDPVMKGKQEWRRSLRDVLNRLRDITRTLFLEHTHVWLTDPMQLRHDWKYAVLTFTEESTIQAHSCVPLSEEQLKNIRNWMQQQDLALKMFTSCGWFFDSHEGIEAQQILEYAQALIDHTHIFVDWSFETPILSELNALLYSDVEVHKV